LKGIFVLLTRRTFPTGFSSPKYFFAEEAVNTTVFGASKAVDLFPFNNLNEKISKKVESAYKNLFSTNTLLSYFTILPDCFIRTALITSGKFCLKAGATFVLV
jgi:hypothetical protein